MPTELAGKPLSQALKRLLAGKSWNEVKRLIASRHVQINGNLCLDEARKLTTKDVVKVWEQPLAKPAGEGDVRIVYVDEHLVVVEKPAGVTTLRHAEERSWPARRKQLQATIDELLPRVLAKHLGWNVDTNPKRERGPARKPARVRGSRSREAALRLPRVRAVHRLDRDTSGLMVFARTPSAEQALIRLFAKHKIDRAYLAVVHGHPQEQSIDTLLVRDRGDGLRGSISSRHTPCAVADERSEVGQRAITHIKPLETIGLYSIVECSLETGRTHQIRIHLSEIGHMLCGEKTYTHPLGGRPQPDDSRAPRHALHAAELGFVHPLTGQKLVFKSRWPKELAAWLTRLRQSASRNTPDTENAENTDGRGQ
ncbi:MAG TPA: RluA family pseudouridine synthase [Pirellulaceae bacterium]|nr:RluA family pseudouridine synthase [Pirellulaceae bacterium]